MSLPETVTEHLDGEQAVAEVGLGGDDRLIVTPTRTLIYRAQGLLSDETVDELPHDIEQITVEKSRRKATLELEYPIEGEKSVTLPIEKLDEVLHPMLAGVLDAKGVSEPGERVKHTFRFSELTLIITSKRVVKHIGQSVWDEEFEEYPFEDVTNLSFEPGNVATSVVLSLEDRQERFKAPNEDARAVEQAVKDALFAYYDVSNIEEFRELGPDEATDPSVDEEPEDHSPFGEGPELFGTEQAAEDEPEPGTDSGDLAGEGLSDDADSGTAIEPTPVPEKSGESGDLAAEVADLRDAVERQRAELERQSDLIDTLIEELRSGR